MVVENPLPPFIEWLPEAFVHWAVAAFVVALVAVLLSFIFTAAQRGPMPAADAIYARIVGSVNDIAMISPRRVLALAGLAFKEAIRRRVWIALAVFSVVL